MDKDTLPAMPPSDEVSLKNGHFDSYYNITSQDFWSGNKVERIEDIPAKKCNHEFIRRENGAVCKHCHFGLVGQLEIKKGKLFYRGESLGL
jgi:hypothetical protein